jgi:hypothetical membrane protein
MHKEQIAGCLLLLAGSAILLGIITAEALYPDVYTTFDNEISDLGATRPPNSIILQPSATVFNTLMMATGAMLFVAAFFLQDAFHTRRVTVSSALMGLGVLGVGVFPGNHGTLHPLFALMAFLSGGFAALLSSHIQVAPFRYFSMLLGGLALASLAIGVFGGESSVFFDQLGDGGVERWIAYPVVLWMVAFGAYLTVPTTTRGSEPSLP